MNLEDLKDIDVDKLPRELTPEESKDIEEKIEQLYRHYEDDKDFESGDVDIDNDFS